MSVEQMGKAPKEIVLGVDISEMSPEDKLAWRSLRRSMGTTERTVEQMRAVREEHGDWPYEE